MIYELRTDTLFPDRWDEFTAVTREIGFSIRTRHCRCLGSWLSQVGDLNLIVHLWEYDDFAHWTQVDRVLNNDKDWNEYLTLARPCLIRQESTILILSNVWPLTLEPSNSIYELRRYRLHPGKVNEWLDHFAKGLPARTKYSKPVGIWYSEVGSLNMIYHMWGYADLQARAEIRQKAARDVDWTDTVTNVLPLIQEMTNQILSPTDLRPAESQ